ncbi:MAG TPA: NAD(P)-dependent glycerol-3-phosphate dehydrogenase [Thiotrichaceae bacterium]|jgi:glycerol-3-phosphate dehydrogenase (NAD(P)+)|nr:NAD(P)-dependent glycerol-3-phosphate dehydrogenase [Thiotrichaceae bacterium]HIM07407.1 NAD(P)-dependent glycerol-3-phosphate dehydrogenase [Gammaproteobacteria bacterium]
MTIQSVLVLGAGSWGTALALALARNKHSVYLWDIDSELISNLQTDKCNKRYIPNVTLPENLFPIASLEDAPTDLKLAVNAVPCHGLRSSLSLLKSFSDIRICVASKGFEPDTQKFNHQVVEEELGEASFAILSGPSFAKEVAAGLPTAVTIAAKDINVAQSFSDLFHDDVFRTYTHSDYIGVQIGGAVKNVMAIAAGIADGLGFGTNARAALVTRGLNEIMRLGLAMGAKQETFMGLAGLGDLVLTCTDNQSRNRSLGLLLAEGLSIQEASDKIGQAIEGLKTAKEVATLAKKYDIEMPITEQVNKVLQSECSPRDAVQNLLAREAKAEM